MEISQHIRETVSGSGTGAKTAGTVRIPGSLPRGHRTSLIGDRSSAFLVHAVSLKPRAELLAVLRSQIGGSGEWDDFVFCAKRNRVAGLILQNLKQLAYETMIPETPRAALGQLAALVANRYPTDVQNLVAIHTAFKAG